jgi:hypothetical protein
MGDGAPDESGRDEFIKGKIGGFREKYGKYLGRPPKVEATVAEIKPEEGAEAPGEPGKEQAKEPEKEEPKEPKDIFEGLNGGHLGDMVGALKSFGNGRGKK